MIPALILVAIACCILAYLLYGQSHPHGDPLAGVDAAATDIQGAISVGVNYDQFGDKLQRFSTAIMAAAQTQEEKDVDPRRLDIYGRALDAYKDSMALWSDKIQYSSLYELENAHGGPVLGLMMNKYQVRRDSTPSYPGINVFYCDQTIRVIWTRAGEDVIQARYAEVNLPMRPGKYVVTLAGLTVLIGVILYVGSRSKQRSDQEQSSGDTGGRVRCETCAEFIQAQAVKCRFCGATRTPDVARPAEHAQRDSQIIQAEPDEQIKQKKLAEYEANTRSLKFFSLGLLLVILFSVIAGEVFERQMAPGTLALQTPQPTPSKGEPNVAQEGVEPAKRQHAKKSEPDAAKEGVEPAKQDSELEEARQQAQIFWARYFTKCGSDYTAKVTQFNRTTIKLFRNVRFSTERDLFASSADELNGVSFRGHASMLAELERQFDDGSWSDWKDSYMWLDVEAVKTKGNWSLLEKSAAWRIWTFDPVACAEIGLK